MRHRTSPKLPGSIWSCGLPSRFARYLCGFLACTHLGVEDLHDVKCNRILREVDIQLRKADSQKTLNRIAAVRNCCQHHDMRFLSS